MQVLGVTVAPLLHCPSLNALSPNFLSMWYFHMIKDGYNALLLVLIIYHPLSLDYHYLIISHFLYCFMCLLSNIQYGSWESEALMRYLSSAFCTTHFLHCSQEMEDWHNHAWWTTALHTWQCAFWWKSLYHWSWRSVFHYLCAQF